MKNYHNTACTALASLTLAALCTFQAFGGGKDIYGNDLTRTNLMGYVDGGITTVGDISDFVTNKQDAIFLDGIIASSGDNILHTVAVTNGLLYTHTPNYMSYLWMCPSPLGTSTSYVYTTGIPTAEMGTAGVIAYSNVICTLEDPVVTNIYRYSDNWYQYMTTNGSFARADRVISGDTMNSGSTSLSIDPETFVSLTNSIGSVTNKRDYADLSYTPAGTWYGTVSSEFTQITNESFNGVAYLTVSKDPLDCTGWTYGYFDSETSVTNRNRSLSFICKSFDGNSLHGWESKEDAMAASEGVLARSASQLRLSKQKVYRTPAVSLLLSSDISAKRDISNRVWQAAGQWTGSAQLEQLKEEYNTGEPFLESWNDGYYYAYYKNHNIYDEAYGSVAIVCMSGDIDYWPTEEDAEDATVGYLYYDGSVEQLTRTKRIMLARTSDLPDISVKRDISNRVWQAAGQWTGSAQLEALKAAWNSGDALLDSYDQNYYYYGFYTNNILGADALGYVFKNDDYEGWETLEEALAATSGTFTQEGSVIPEESRIHDETITRSDQVLLALSTEVVNSSTEQIKIGEDAEIQSPPWSTQSIVIGEHASSVCVTNESGVYTKKADSTVVIGSKAKSAGSRGIAIGYRSDAYGDFSVAIGSAVPKQTTEGGTTVTTWFPTVASNQSAIAIGYGAQANAYSAVQVGTGTNSTSGTFKFMDMTIATQSGLAETDPAVDSLRATNTLLLAGGAAADGLSGGIVAIGALAAVSNNDAYAIGANAMVAVLDSATGLPVASAGGAVQIGNGINRNASSLQFRSTPIVVNNKIPAGSIDDTIARLDSRGKTLLVNKLSFMSSSSELAGIAIGYYATVSNASSGIAIGRYATVSNASSGIAIGRYATVSNASSGIAIGTSAQSTSASTAIGQNAISKGSNSFAAGTFASTIGISSIAIGTRAYTTADQAIAIGGRDAGSAKYTTASAIGAVQIGPGTNSDANSLKFGNAAGTVNTTVVNGNGKIPVESLSSPLRYKLTTESSTALLDRTINHYTMTGDTTFSFPDAVSGEARDFMLIITVDISGAVTLPARVTTSGDTLSFTSGKTNMVTFTEIGTRTVGTTTNAWFYVRVIDL